MEVTSWLSKLNMATLQDNCPTDYDPNNDPKACEVIESSGYIIILQSIAEQTGSKVCIHVLHYFYRECVLIRDRFNMEDHME